MSAPHSELSTFSETSPSPPLTPAFNPFEFLRSIGPCPCKCKKIAPDFEPKCTPVPDESTKRTSLGDLSWESVTSDDDLMGYYGDRFLNCAPLSDDNNLDLGRHKINVVSPTRQTRRVVKTSEAKVSRKSKQEGKVSAQKDDVLSRLESSRKKLLVAMDQSAESRRALKKRRISSLDRSKQGKTSIIRKELYEATKDSIA